MDNPIAKKIKEEDKILFFIFVIILSIFLSALTIMTVVNIGNKIKEGKYIGQEIETRNTITVSDTGEVYAKPDLALSTFSVITEDKTVDKAMLNNTEKMNAIVSFMKGQDIEEKDLKTTGFNIYPLYEWKKTTEDSLYPQGERVLVGYEVRQSLEVKIRDMEKIGPIIEGAAAAGANQVGDLTFTIDKQDELKEQARKQAIDKAKKKADELAGQLGIKLVRIASFYESTSYPGYYGKGIGGGGDIMAESAPMAAPTIETGENKIEVTVNITYTIE